MKTALEEAKQAGIPVVSQEAADCNDVDPSATSYFAQNLEFFEGNFITGARPWARLRRLAAFEAG